MRASAAVAALAALALPALATATDYHFSDCQQGAATGCVPGDNRNAGTDPAAPKRNLHGFDANAVPAGTRLLFARGGAWSHATLVLENLQATPERPLVIDAYGSGSAPLWRTVQGNAIDFGGWQNTSNDGGYTIRNLRLDGLGSATWGLWLRDNVRHVTVENLEITGFAIGIHSQSGTPHGVSHVSIRNSRIALNRDIGLLASFDEALIENNVFERNNFSGSVFRHAIYLGSGQRESRNVTIRGNTLRNNSICRDAALCPGKRPVTGACDGGNLTVHGRWTRVLIENNRIEQPASSPGCYGISITAGYDSPEWFRDFVVRGNVLINLGACSVCASAAPGILVEGNTIINRQENAHTGIAIGGRLGPGDAPDAGAMVRNNVACFERPARGQAIARVAGAGAVITGNSVHTGEAAGVKCPPH